MKKLTKKVNAKTLNGYSEIFYSCNCMCPVSLEYVYDLKASFFRY
ncbi:hypothetical protein [Abyssisolibacter fermentans]|nr:hypothetical protein [Abyssisolibacter fermentans]